jgi:hypothetical protein
MTSTSTKHSSIQLNPSQGCYMKEARKNYVPDLMIVNKESEANL